MREGGAFCLNTCAECSRSQASRAAVCEPSASAPPQGGMFDGGGVGGPRRIIFDLENISEHDKAAGAKSEGLTSGLHGCKVQAS